MGAVTRAAFVVLAAMSLSCSGSGFKVATPEGRRDLAACLSAKGYVLYTADYCGHCHRQVEMFGAAAVWLKNVSCKKGIFDPMLPVCAEAGVRSYPTWVAPDGSKRSGVRDLAELASWSDCGS